MMNHRRTRAASAAVGLLAVALTIGASGARAQSSPENLPASIFQGTCAEFVGEPLVNLNQVTPNDPRIGGTFRGSTDALGVLTSESDVRISLRTLLGSPYAIVIGDPTAPLACGEIGGFTRGVITNDDLDIGLQPVGDSGIFGIAQLEGDGDETEVDLMVAAPYRR